MTPLLPELSALPPELVLDGEPPGERGWLKVKNRVYGGTATRYASLATPRVGASASTPLCHLVDDLARRRDPGRLRADGTAEVQIHR
jgi:hypothetical protein